MKTETSKPARPRDKAQEPQAKIEGVQELTDAGPDKAAGGMRKAGGDPNNAGKPFIHY